MKTKRTLVFTLMASFMALAAFSSCDLLNTDPASNIPSPSLVGTSPFTKTIKTILYDNNTYIAGTEGGELGWSPDGENWTVIEAGTKEGQSQFINAISALSSSNNIFVAAASFGMAWSEDGKTWKPADRLPEHDEHWGFTPYSIIWNGSQFIALINSQIITSQDGKTWTDPIAFYGTSSATIVCVNGLYVAAGISGNQAGISFSNDLTNWTTKKYDKFGGMLYDITYGNGIFVVVGFNGAIAWSPDAGIDTWTTQSESIFGAAFISAIAYGDGVFVAGGDSGKMAYSRDGKKWALFEGNDRIFGASAINDIAWDGKRFIAVGDSGKIGIFEHRYVKGLADLIRN
jgi:hypothetical protein